MTLQTKQSLLDLDALQGQSRVWLCGAYALHGVPLLENAVRSGLGIAERISGGQRPWGTPPSGANPFAKNLIGESHGGLLGWIVDKPIVGGIIGLVMVASWVMWRQAP